MIDNPEYEKELAQLKRNDMILRVVACLVIIFVNSDCVSRYGNMYMLLPLCFLLIFINLYMNICFEKKELELAYKHNLMNNHEKAEKEAELNSIALKISDILRIHPVKIKIVAGNRMQSIYEVRPMHSLIFTASILEIENKQLEFLLLDALIDFKWKLLASKYSLMLSILPATLIIPIIFYFSQATRIILLSVLTALIVIIAVNAIVNIKKETNAKYTKILSITKDYESARSTLLFESKLHLAKMQPKTIEILTNGLKLNELPQEEKELRITGTDEKLAKLKEAAVELGLIKK